MLLSGVTKAILCSSAKRQLNCASLTSPALGLKSRWVVATQKTAVLLLAVYGDVETNWNVYSRVLDCGYMESVMPYGNLSKRIGYTAKNLIWNNGSTYNLFQTEKMALVLYPCILSPTIV